MLLPATFGEFVKAMNPKLYSTIISSNDPVYEMFSRMSSMRELLEKYLMAGGFPKAQHEVIKFKKCPMIS